MWTIGRSKRAKLISEGQNEVANVQCVSSKEMESNGNLEKYLGERIFKRISELQDQLNQCHKETAEHLDKIAELEARVRVESKEKAEYLKAMLEVQGELKEAHQETAEHVMNIWKLDEKLLVVEDEKMEYLKHISELEEELRVSVKRTGTAIPESPEAHRRSAERQYSSGASSDTSGSYGKRSMPPDSDGPKSRKRRPFYPAALCYHGDDSKSFSDESKSSRSKS